MCYVKKEFTAWEKTNISSNGLYGRYAAQIARAYPALSPQELRIASLIGGLLATAQIADILCVSEETIVNHRVNIRKKLKLNGKQKLSTAILRATEI